MEARDGDLLQCHRDRPSETITQGGYCGPSVIRVGRPKIAYQQPCPAARN